MRVALIGDYPPPHGGVSVHVAGLSRALRRCGVEVRILDIGRGQHAGECITPGRGALPYARGLAALAAGGFLLHAHTSGANRKSWLVALAAGRARLPGGPRGVLTLHSGHASAWLTRSAERRSLARLACSGFGYVVAVNQEIADALTGCGLPPRRIVVLPGFSPTLLEPGPPPVALAAARQAHAPLFCAMASPGPTYGVDLLRAAFALVRRRRRGAGLVLFGPGAEHRVAEPGVHDLGEIPHGAALGVMAACDVFVRPTRADGDALSVREALGLGLPVVASTVGYRPPGCLLYRPDDVAGLAARLDEAADRSRQATPRSDGDPFEDLLNAYAELWSARPLLSGGPGARRAPTL
jgi:glycogen(starch) synthase